MAEVMKIKWNWNTILEEVTQEALDKQHKLLPIGTHVATLVKVDQWENDASQQSTLILTFKATEGEHQDKVGYARIMLYKIKKSEVDKRFYAIVGEFNPQSLLKINEFMIATGLAIPDGEFTFNANNYVGKTIKVVIAAGKNYKNREGVMTTPLNVVGFKTLQEAPTPLHNISFDDVPQKDILLNKPVIAHPIPESVPWDEPTPINIQPKNPVEKPVDKISKTPPIEKLFTPK